jgi:hypothetical protein
MIGLEDDIGARPAVAPAGTAFGPGVFAQKGDAPLPAVAGPPVDFDLVNEHEWVSATKKARLKNLAANQGGGG